MTMSDVTTIPQDHGVSVSPGRCDEDGRQVQASRRGHPSRGRGLQGELCLNPVQFMSLFGHALFNYNPPLAGQRGLVIFLS